MRSDMPVPCWWLIGATTAISVPGAIVVVGFDLIAAGACDTTCDTGGYTAIGILAVVALVLSAVSAVAVVMRRPLVALVSWIAMLASWATVAAVFLSR